MPKKSTRLQLPALGEVYSDLLTLDSAINGRSEPMQAQSLLCAKLQEREERINERVRYLAAKRGISFEEMRSRILDGKYAKENLENDSDSE